MNQGTIVRADAEENGLRLRIWVDDEAGKHLTVTEVFIPLEHLATYFNDTKTRYQGSQQYSLNFDT